MRELNSLAARSRVLADERIMGFQSGHLRDAAARHGGIAFPPELPQVDDLMTMWEGTLWARRTPEDDFPFDPSSDPMLVGQG